MLYWLVQNLHKIIWILFGLIALVYLVIFPIMNYSNPEVVTGTVTDAYIKRYSEKDRFHVVLKYADGTKEIFQNRDAFWLGKFDSADVQQQIEKDVEYSFDVRGMRIPFLSMFRNIISFAE